MLGSITTYNGSWTATENCIMIVDVIKAGNSSGYNAMVYVNGNYVISVYDQSNAGGSIGNSNGYGIPISKGDVVTTRNQSGQTYNVKFYGITFD